MNKLKKILFIILSSQIIFLLFYNLFLKNFIFRKINENLSLIDRIYYNNIFSNLEVPIISAIIFFSLIIIFYEHLYSAIQKIVRIKNWVYYLILVNIIIQLFLIFNFETKPISDSEYYIRYAERLYLTGSYLNDFGNYTAFWPVGLPAFLCLLKNFFNGIIFPMKIINVIISSGLIFVLYKTFKYYLSKKQLFIFCLLQVIYPNYLFSANIVMTELPFLFLFWLTFYLWKSDKNYFKYISGVLFALMSFLKPVALILPIIFFMLDKNKNGLYKSLKKYVFIVGVMLLCLSPWVYRNYKIFNSFVPVATNGGFNFLMGNHLNSSGGINFNFSFDIENKNEAEEDKKAYAKGFNDIIKSPLKSLVRMPMKLLYSYYRGDSSITWALKKTHNQINPKVIATAFYFTNLFFYIIIFFSLIKLLCNLNYFKKEIEFIFIFFFFLLLILLFVGSERYIITILPIHFYWFVKQNKY